MAFINQNEEDNQAQAPNTNEAAPASSPSAGSAPMGSATASPAAPKGSGRFTNIQKYISANQGASDRLAGGVNTKIQGQINPNLKKSEDNLGSIRSGIAAGRGTLQQGNQINEQVQKADFDAQGFANNPDNINKFTQFRTGQAVDEGALRNQAQTAQQQTLAAQQKANELGQQFSTEQGRQQLLKQTFSPGRNYTTGQQRLDGLFLQQAAPQMKNIQGSISDAANKFGSFNNQLSTEAGNVDLLAGDEQALAKNLQQGIGNRANDVVSQVASTSDAVNAARREAQNAANANFVKLSNGKAVDQNFANLMGLKTGDKLFNTLKNDGSYDDYVKLGSTTLTSPDQLATAKDRAKYDAISKLAGYDDATRAIKNDTKVEDAVSSTGKMRRDIDTGLANFNAIKDTTLGNGSAQSTYFNVPTRESWGANSTANLNLAQAGNLVDSNKIDDSFFAPTSDASRDGFSQYLNGSGFNGQAGAGSLTKYENPLLNSINSNTGFTGHQGDRNDIAYGTNTQNNATQIARLRALQDAYRQLSEQGYTQNVGIEDPTLENAPKVTG